MDNQETLTPLGYTRHRTKTRGQSRDTDIIWVHKTQDEDKGTINNKQSRDTHTIWVHKKQNEDKGTTNNGQSRDTDTIGYTRHRTKTQGQSRMDNQETLTPLGT